MKKILVVNNNDSFIYNLVEYLRLNGNCIFDVVLTHELNFSTLSKYDAILLSPGAGLPGDYPEMMKLIDKSIYTHSILGVCLGHQAISLYFGSKLRQLNIPKHGYCSKLNILEPLNILFQSVGEECEVGRYHSWVVDSKLLPPDLVVTSIDEDNNIMSISHSILPIHGVQFHPESIITHRGRIIINNWIESIVIVNPKI